MEHLDDVVVRNDSALLTMIEPVTANLDPIGWARNHRDAVRSLLTRHRALLLRDFAVPSRTVFGEVVSALGHPIDYVFRSTPRKSFGRKIYSATEYPREYEIPLHCENAYQAQWPLLLFFYCEQSAQSGGETPLADMACVTRDLDPAACRALIEKGVRYVRNYHPGIDLPWEEVFQTNSRAKVMAHCKANGIDCRWRPDGLLRTAQVRPAMATHPGTGQSVWFNQAHLFHISGLDSGVRQSLQKMFSDEELPRNAFYGDGSPIELDVLEHIRGVFQSHKTTFPWQRGDILIIDNMAVAHGRNAYTGSRSIAVMMADRNLASDMSLPAARGGRS
jgi:alpha-ketoglutarate-dependent taurine dioxygenase